MKSIYDEALKEISEQKEAWGVRIRSIVPTQLDMISRAIEQAQKQEQLLELYKELVKEIKNYILGNINDIDYSNTVLKVNNLDKQIKELENEIKPQQITRS